MSVPITIQVPDDNCRKNFRDFVAQRGMTVQAYLSKVVIMGANINIMSGNDSKRKFLLTAAWQQPILIKQLILKVQPDAQISTYNDISQFLMYASNPVYNEYLNFLNAVFTIDNDLWTNVEWDKLWDLTGVSAEDECWKVTKKPSKKSVWETEDPKPVERKVDSSNCLQISTSYSTYRIIRQISVDKDGIRKETVFWGTAAMITDYIYSIFTD